MSRPFKCPYCESYNTAKKGFRVTKTMGKRRLMRCRACGRKFTPKIQRPIEDEVIDANTDSSELAQDID